MYCLFYQTNSQIRQQWKATVTIPPSPFPTCGHNDSLFVLGLTLWHFLSHHKIIIALTLLIIALTSELDAVYFRWGNSSHVNMWPSYAGPSSLSYQVGSVVVLFVLNS